MAKIRVLLVDDDRFSMKSVSMYLQTIHHFSVYGLESAESALEELKKIPITYDVVVADWTLVTPGEIPILESIKLLAPNLPVIVITAYEGGAEALGQGAFAYYRKPADPELLAQAIQNAVNSKKSPHQAETQLYNLNTLLMEHQTLTSFSTAIIKKANDLTGSQTGCMYRWHWDGAIFKKLQGLGCLDETGPSEVPASVQELFSGEKRDILLYPDTTEKAFENVNDSKINSQAVLLLRRGSLPLGLLVLGRTDGNPFEEESHRVLSSLKEMVEPLFEQFKTRELLQELEQGQSYTEQSLGQICMAAIYELLGRPAALWMLDGGLTQFKIKSLSLLPEGYSTEIPAFDKKSLFSQAVKKVNLKRFIHWSIQDPKGIKHPLELEGINGTKINSLLVVPMVTSEDAPLGVIAVYGASFTHFAGYDMQYVDFTEYEVQLVRNIAAQVARSIENLRTRQRATLLAELGGQLIAEGKSEQETFEQFAETIMEMTGAANVVIYPYDADRKYYVPPAKVIIKGNVLARQEISDKERDKGLAPVVRFSEKVIVEDVQGGNDALIVEDLEKTPGDRKMTREFLQQIISDGKFINRERIRAFIGLALRAPQSPDDVGVMYINYQAPHHFTRSEIDTLQIATRQVGSSIDAQRATRRQQAISETLKGIIDVIGTPDALGVILDKTARLFAVDHASISRVSDDGAQIKDAVLWERGKLNSLSEDTAGPRLLTIGITGHVVSTGKSYRTGDVLSDKTHYQQWQESTRSELAVPLVNAFGGVIGALDLESDHYNFFSEEQERLCENMAHAVSAAIQQSALFEAVQALHAITETGTFKGLLHQVLANLNKMLGIKTASSINLYDRKEDNFYSFYGVGPDPDFINDYLLVPPRKIGGTGRHVLKTGQPLFYEDISKPPAGYPQVRQEAWNHKVRSFAVLPLKFGDEILGALFVHKLEETAKFPDGARRILQTYAAQAALVIHNAQRQVEIEPLKDILNATVTESREKILKIIVEKAVDIMESDYASVWLSNNDGDLERAEIYVRPGEKVIASKHVRILSHNENSINMRVFKEKKASVINDVRIEEAAGRYNRIYEKALSEIAVPLVFKGQVIGTLNTESHYLGAFSEFDYKTLQLFADVAVIALEIHRKSDEVRQQKQDLEKKAGELNHMNYRLEALTEIGQQLTAHVESGEHEILSIIHEQASKIMDTENMYIALYQPENDLVYFELAFIDGIAVDIENNENWKPRSEGQGRTEWIIRHKHSLLTYTRLDAEEWYKANVAKDYIDQKFASWLGVPIMFGEDVLGVIATYHKEKEYQYKLDDQKVLELMGRQAAIALKNARLVNKLDIMRQLGEDLSGAFSNT